MGLLGVVASLARRISVGFKSRMFHQCAVLGRLALPKLYRVYTRFYGRMALWLDESGHNIGT